MLFLVSVALRSYPLVLPQVISLVTGMDPLDPEFRRRWSACLEWIGERLFGPTRTSAEELEREKTDASSGQNKTPIKTHRRSSAVGRPKSGVKANQ